MLLRRASDLKPYIKAIVYGAPNAGKTSFAVTGHDTPGLGPVLLVDVEEGSISASHTTATITPKIDTKAGIMEVLHGLHHKKDEFQHFQTVVIDTGTRLQTVILDHVIRATIKRKSQSRDVDEVYIKDYGDCGKVMMRIVAGFFALEMHVILLAHSRDISPRVPDGATPKPPTATVPDFTPALGRTLMGYADNIWYIAEHEGKRYLMTQPPDKPTIIRTKTRGHVFAKLLGSTIEAPNLPDIYDKLKLSTKKEK